MNDQRPNPALRRRFEWFESLLSVLNSIGTLWIFALMVVISLDVIGRTAFNAPLPGVLELVRLSIVGIVFIQLAHTLRAGRVTRADNLLRILQRRRPRLGYGLEMVFSLTGAMIFFVLLRASLPLFLKSWGSGEYAGIEGYITYPVWPVRLIILIGSLCAGLQFLLFAWRDLQVVLSGVPPIEDVSDSSESLAYGDKE